MFIKTVFSWVKKAEMISKQTYVPNFDRLSIEDLFFTSEFVLNVQLITYDKMEV